MTRTMDKVFRKLAKQGTRDPPFNHKNVPATIVIETDISMFLAKGNLRNGKKKIFPT